MSEGFLGRNVDDQTGTEPETVSLRGNMNIDRTQNRRKKREKEEEDERDFATKLNLTLFEAKRREQERVRVLDTVQTQIKWHEHLMASAEGLNADEKYDCVLYSVAGVGVVKVARWFVEHVPELLEKLGLEGPTPQLT